VEEKTSEAPRGNRAQRRREAAKARLDARRAAKPRTRLRGVHPAGVCGRVVATELENVATGERTPLAEEPLEERGEGE
jgi:hypothetical protein